jgi:hypothetical protein
MKNILLEDQRNLFALHDSSKAQGGMRPTHWREAEKLNHQGFGIFWTVQKMKDELVRTKANVEKIISWAIDIDAGSKEEQKTRIKKFLTPSLVIETKRGYQVYYNAKDASLENFESIMEDYLLPALDGDRNASDLARVLRAPNFYHLKNPNDPFFVKVVHTSENVYSEEQIKKVFPLTSQQKQTQSIRNEFKREMKFVGGDDVWQKIWNLDCEQALMRLSGTEAVGFETYTFKKAPRGCLNIFVNGQGTSCWIDPQKRIGSKTKGGPSVAQWVNWFHKDYKKTLKFLKQIFPEVFSHE